MSEQPTDDVAAVDVEDHVEMETGPFGRALQFGDIPGPHFIGPDRQELGLGVEWMNSLTAALASLMLGCQETIHKALEPVRQGVHRCFGTIAPGGGAWIEAASRSWL